MGTLASRALSKVLSSGVVGAAAVAGLHQLARHLMKDAPRVDLLGEQVFAKLFAKLGRAPPVSPSTLSWLVGNLGSDALLFGLVDAGSTTRPFARGAAVGTVVGAAAVVGPRLLRLGEKHTAKNARMALATMGLYVGAGVAAGAAKWVTASAPR
jgi:hypothetical protein